MPLGQGKIMRVLFFDTETNGLPLSKYGLGTDTKNWPLVVQLAWEIWEMSEGQQPVQVSKASHILQPPSDVVWNNESAAIHGITKERAIAEGVPGKVAFEEFSRNAGQCSVIVAHNLAFDKPVIKAEFYRLNASETFSWWPPYEYCTMENTTHMCKLPRKYPTPHDPYKYPRLNELYTHLYGTVPDFEFHSASGDVECLVECFHELLRRKVLPFEAWERARRV